MYVERYFPESSKQRMLQLVHNLQKALGQRIDQQTWMSAATKKQAHEKLNTFRIKIGYPDEWRNYDGLVIDEKLSFYENLRRAEEFDNAYEIARRVNKPVDRNEWFMTPQTINAYYDPTMNEIVFPAAILQAPFFDPKADDASNFGAIGAIIGHEIGHGFDVPIVGFDALVEDFGATTLVGDDGRHAALHGFEGRDAEGFGHRGHDIDVGVAEHLVDFAAFHEAGEVEAVGNAAPRREFDHGLHHVARTGEAEADVAGAFEHQGGGFDEILGAFLHGDAAEEGHHLLLSLGSGAALRHDPADVVGKGVDGVVHRHHFRRILPVVVDDRAAEMGVTRVWVTLSHEKEYATAYCILEGQ